MVQGFELSLSERQGIILEEALRKHLTFLNDQSTLATMTGNSGMAIEYSSMANVVRNTLAQVKDGLYNITMEE